MSKQSIGLGAAPNDGSGDVSRVAGQKVNENFNELYLALGDGTDLAVTAFARSIMNDDDAPAVRTTLGLGTAATSATGDFAASSHGHAAGDLTSGTLADARVAESNVTQHEAALNITEAQISDLGAYATSLSGLADVDATVGSPSDGDVMVWRAAGADWVLEAKPAGGSNPAMSDVTDVTITSVADNEVLAYDNGTGEWINQTAAEAGLAAASHTHAASDVGSGTFADARIAESSVTQHEAALTITESQISDLGDPSYVDAAASSNTTTAMSGNTVRSTGGSATTLTVVSDTITRATTLVQTGAGALTVAAGGGVTINPQPGGTLISAGQHAILALVPVGANTYVLTGATTTA